MQAPLRGSSWSFSIWGIESKTALRILLTMLEESRDCFESVDDSDGDLGDYFGSLGETLAEVILSLDGDGQPRAELLRDRGLAGREEQRSARHGCVRPASCPQAAEIGSPRGHRMRVDADHSGRFQHGAAHRLGQQLGTDVAWSDRTG